MSLEICTGVNTGQPCGNQATTTEPVALCDGHKFQIGAIAEGVENPPHRSMAEWVALAGPVYQREYRFLGGRMPTAIQFAIVIRRAGLGEITAAQAKSIRTEILKGLS